MVMTIGIFDKEEEVKEAVRLLRGAGVDNDEIRVVVGNREGAPILESSGDVHIEEFYEIQETRAHDGEDHEIPLGVAPVAAGYTVGSTANGFSPAGVIMARFGWDDDSSREEVLHDIGISDQAAEKCGKAVESGRILLMADADSEINLKTLLSHAGAADVFFA